MYKRPANSIKTSGEYLFKTKNKTYELESYLFERQGDTEDSLQIQDELRGELGSILIKNSSWGKLSKGDPIRAKSSKGNISGVLVRAERFSKGGGVGDNKVNITKNEFHARKDEPNRVFHSYEGNIGDYTFTAETDSNGTDGINKGSIYYLNIYNENSNVGRYDRKWEYRSKNTKDGAIRSTIIKYIDSISNKKDGELKRFSKGGNVTERRYVNKSEDYETRYAKNKPKRTGFKNNIKFEGGGSIEEYKKAESDYDKYGEYLEDAIEDGNEADIKKYKKLMDEAESIMHRHERKYEGGGEVDGVSFSRVKSSFKDNLEVFNGEVVKIGESKFKIEGDKLYRKTPTEDWHIWRIIKGEMFAEGGEMGKKLKGYRVYVFESSLSSRDNALKGDSYVLVTDGIQGDSSQVDSDEVYLKLVKRHIFGKDILHAEPVNINRRGNQMFGGKFVWSTDSRFRNDISESPIQLHDRFESYAVGGEIQSKIDKLQAVVNSKMLPESVKDKARKQIAELEKELNADSVLKKSESYHEEGKDVYGDSFYQWHNISMDGDQDIFAYSTPRGTVIYGEDSEGEKDFSTSFTTEPYYLEEAPEEDYSFNSLQESKIKAFELLRTKKLGRGSKELHESKETKAKVEENFESSMPEWLKKEFLEASDDGEFQSGFGLEGNQKAMYNKMVTDKELFINILKNDKKDFEHDIEYEKSNGNDYTYLLNDYDDIIKILNKYTGSNYENKYKETKTEEKDKYVVWEYETYKIISKHPTLADAEKYAKELVSKNKSKLYSFGSIEKYERFKAEDKARKQIEQLSKVEEVEEVEDSELKKHIDSLSLSKFVDDASYILSADYDRIEGRASSKEGRDKITVELINKIEKSDDYEKSVYLKEIGFKSKPTETKDIEIKVGQVYKINPKSKSIDNAGGLITVTEIDGGNVTISYTEKGKSKIDFVSESMFNNLIKEGEYILQKQSVAKTEEFVKTKHKGEKEVSFIKSEKVTEIENGKKSENFFKVGESIYGTIVSENSKQYLVKSSNNESVEYIVNKDAVKIIPKPTTIKAPIKKADSVLKKTSTRMPKVAKKEDKTEIILGKKYVVGSPEHKTAVSTKKELDRLQSKVDARKEVKTPKDSWKEKLALLKKKKEYKGQIKKESKAVSGTKSRSIKRDLDNKALPKGKRISKGGSNQYGKSEGGNVYYERRANRSDVNPDEKFEKGGEVKSSNWGINLNW